MNRTIIALLAALMVFASTAPAQLEDEYEPIPPAKPSQGKLGGGGGYTPGWIFLDLDRLNGFITAGGGAPFPDGRLMLNGGQGYAYMLVVSNLRIGGVGMTGTKSSTRVESATNTRRDVDLSVGYGGVTLEYALPIVPRLDITFGTVIGGGGMTLRLRRDQGTARQWGDIWGEIGSPLPVAEYSRKLESSFFVYQPSVTLEFALLRWLGVRAGVGYLGMAGGEWKLDDEYELFGVPEEIDGSGWMIQTGIYVGTFIY